MSHFRTLWLSNDKLCCEQSLFQWSWSAPKTKADVAYGIHDGVKSSAGENKASLAFLDALFGEFSLQGWSI